VAEARAGREEPRGDTAAVTPAGEADVVVARPCTWPRLGRSAVIVEGPLKGKVRVAAGALKLWVDVSELGGAPKDKAAERAATLEPLSGADERGAQHPHRGQHPRSARHARG
jgi:hypothetical protein